MRETPHLATFHGRPELAEALTRELTAVHRERGLVDTD